jgi:hypothetical protein
MATIKHNRDVGIDVFKGLLIIGMILAHVIGVVGNRLVSPLNEMKYGVELVAFSGFLFCFGYGVQLAYFSSPSIPCRRVLITCIRLVIAFYISAISYELLINSSPLGLDGVLSILTLSHIPPVSEFLLNFPLTLLLVLLLIKPIGYVLRSRPRFFVVTTLLLGTTFFPYGLITSPQLGLLVGISPTIFYSYPVVQYLPLFVLGMYFARYPITGSRRLALVGGLGVGAFLIYQQLTGRPTRFPPSLGWVLGSIPFVWVGYVAARRLAAIEVFARLLAPIGANALSFFLLSNILIFALKSSFRALVAGPELCYFITLVVVAVIDFIVSSAHTVSWSTSRAANPQA